MSILNTQIQLVATAQGEYQQAVKNQSSAGVEFWLGQMSILIAQLKELEVVAGSPVATAKMSNDYSRDELNQLQRLIDNEPAQVAMIEIMPPVKPQPTIYAWNDGFEGVSLEDAWDR